MNRVRFGSVYLYIYWIARSYTRLAQSVERTPFKRVVVGSSPTSGGGRDIPWSRTRSLIEEMEGSYLHYLIIK